MAKTNTLIIILICLASCSNEKVEVRCHSMIHVLKMFCTTTKGPTIKYANAQMTAIDYWKQQECKIKTSYQNYNIPLPFYDVRIPVKLIGCACSNEIKDIMPENERTIAFDENDISSKDAYNKYRSQFAEIFKDSLSFQGTTDYLFHLRPDDSVRMGKVAVLIQAYYAAYIEYIYKHFIEDDCFYEWSAEQQKITIRNNSPMLILLPKGIKYNYCEHCNCND